MAKSELIEAEKLARCRLVEKQSFDAGRYEYDFSYQRGKNLNFNSCSSTLEMVALLERDKSIQLDSIVMCANPQRRTYGYKRLNKDKFLEAWRANGKRKFRESVDTFGRDEDMGSGGGMVGQDFIPLLGGPFFKSLYYFNDYIRQHMTAFHAYHHDPIALAFMHITRDFVLGRGFRVDSENPNAMAAWKAFEVANNLPLQISDLCVELGLYGEVMIRWLPDDQSRIVSNPRPGTTVPTGVIPRVRLIDPSTIWEIVTHPEDQTRVLYYQQVFQTQYQLYTGKDGDESVPSSKFIVQQIPAKEMRHYKINCVSNEKRGRSDLYPIFGYLKRLRDSVNYALIGMQKNAAWAIDTTVEGSPTDMQAYVDDQNSMGSIPPAGSEFVHTSKVKRQYLSNSASGKGGDSKSFEWALNMACAGVQIPVSYLGTHLSGGSTRASALVATEPVAKKFENRQQVIETIIRGLWSDLMKKCSIDAECEVTFPEIILQDRSAKLKDLIMCEDAEYFSHERCATIASKEFSMTDYDYDKEVEKIKAERAEKDGLHAPLINPLTAPAQTPTEPTPDKSKPTAVTQDERRSISMGYK